MNYIVAIRAICFIQWKYAGGFIDFGNNQLNLLINSFHFEDFNELFLDSDLESQTLTLLSQSQIQETLTAQALSMKDAIVNNKVGLLGARRFIQEFDIILLLLMICFFGGFNTTVPIEDKDILMVESSVNSLISAGYVEEDEEVGDVIRNMIARLSTTHPLPEPLLKSLLP